MLSKYLVRTLVSHQQKQAIYENKKISDTVILNHGHLTSFLDPLNLDKPLSIKDLEELSETSMSPSAFTFLGERIGFEISHCDIQEQKWLINRINKLKQEKFSKEEKTQIAEAMIRSQTFDAFMQKRFGQVKRYSLEGLEGVITAINQVIGKSEKGSTLVFSMAHRGRLNILTGPIGMPLEAVFAKLKGENELNTGGSADVLSHLSINHIHNERRLIMLPNPSHLEAVNPVHQGFIHALNAEAPSENKVIGVQIHGDGAIACQGVVQEALQLSNLEGFSCGGIIHIIGNNQLAFTADKLKKHSGRYCSDVGHIINAPIFHVNGDDPENICKLMNVAFEYRQMFKKDIFIDIVGFRRWGHNELDEPAFTQPKMYSQIRNRELPGDVYLQELVDTKVIQGLPNWKHEEFEKLDKSLSNCENYQFPPPISEGIIAYKESEKKFTVGDLREIGIKSVTIPNGFVPSKISSIGCESEIN